MMQLIVAKFELSDTYGIGRTWPSWDVPQVFNFWNDSDTTTFPVPIVEEGRGVGPHCGSLTGDRARLLQTINKLMIEWIA
jgi:hypothetical protein